MSRIGMTFHARAMPLLVTGFALGLAVGPGAAVAQNRLTPAEQAEGWKLLFDGTTLEGWRGLGYDVVPTAHWMVQDGAIRKIPSGQVRTQADGQPTFGGDLMTIGAYRDFDFMFEWKVTPGANGGVKYNVSEELSRKIPPDHAAKGFEYQVLDDERHPDGRGPNHRSAGLYDLIAPEGAQLSPVGEWNTARIVLRGNHGEHWVNGKKVVEYELGSAVMDSLLAKSKYRTIPGFADRRAGHIVLQDHTDEVFYRNLKIRDLSAAGSR